MTGNTINISVKVPSTLAERIPAPGQGRSRFIVQALEEKLSRQTSRAWKPTTRRGHRMARILAKGRAEGVQMLNDEAFDRELSARRGRFA